MAWLWNKKNVQLCIVMCLQNFKEVNMLYFKEKIELCIPKHETFKQTFFSPQAFWFVSHLQIIQRKLVCGGIINGCIEEHTEEKHIWNNEANVNAIWVGCLFSSNSVTSGIKSRLYKGFPPLPPLFDFPMHGKPCLWSCLAFLGSVKAQEKSTLAASKYSQINKPFYWNCKLKLL